MTDAGTIPRYTIICGNPGVGGGEKGGHYGG
jgi:hypothetical protein